MALFCFLFSKAPKLSAASFRTNLSPLARRSFRRSPSPMPPQTPRERRTYSWTQCSLTWTEQKGTGEILLQNIPAIVMQSDFFCLIARFPVPPPSYTKFGKKDISKGGSDSESPVRGRTGIGIVRIPNHYSRGQSCPLPPAALI